MQLVTILPDLRIPEPAPTVFNAPRVFFPNPTPGYENNFGAEEFVGRMIFSEEHGFHDAPFLLEISNETANVDIYYTLDGTDPRLPGGDVSPTALEAVPGEPLRIAPAPLVRVRARAFAGGVWSALEEGTFEAAP